jgi:hypothetical protein
MTVQAWQADVGPRQRKDLERAIGRLRWEGQTHIQLSGVKGGKEHRTALTSVFGPARAEATAADLAIREKYGYKVDRKNVREVIAAYEQATTDIGPSRIVEDTRRSPEEDTAIQEMIAEREAGYAAERDAQAALLEQVTAKAPSWAKALIVAEYNVDKSEPQTDYFANASTRRVAIGWRSGSREDFRQLRAAAAQFSETWGLTFEERRDNYSMGKGNYLSDHGWDGAGTGWVVKSYALPAKWARLTEDAIPGQPAAPAPAELAASAGGVTVRPGQAGKVEVVFDEKPAPEVRKALKDKGFRWHPPSGCWYGRDKAFAESLVGS